MCNKYGFNSPLHRLMETFGTIRWSTDLEPLPNLAPLDEINPTDPAPLVRRAGEGHELIQMRWGYPPGRPGAGPVINLRSENRQFGANRCLAVATHFFEFTGAKYPKTRWRFTMTGEEIFAIAGVWRGAGDDARFTMLTIDPGPDVAEYHDRQIVPLAPSSWDDWLNPEIDAQTLLKPGPAGSLAVSKDR